MNTYYRVKEVTPARDYTLLMTFETGERKVYDMKPLIAGAKEDWHVFKPLNDADFFMTAKSDGVTVFWGDGDIDIAPEELYQNSTPV